MRGAGGHACCLLDPFERTRGVVKDMICPFPLHPVCLCLVNKGKHRGCRHKGCTAMSPLSSGTQCLF